MEARQMRNFCPFCKNPLTPWYQWQASDGRLYCNEFCADAGETTVEVPPSVVEFPDPPAQRT
jgi:hypothetical protein